MQIKEKHLTQEVLNKTVFDIYNINKDNQITQYGIYKILRPRNYTNGAIAKVINYLIPDAKATGNSVAQLAFYFKRKEQLLEWTR